MALGSVPITPGTGQSVAADTTTIAGVAVPVSELTDGTNVVGVAAPNTAVAAGKPALAVGLHPSSPLPAGTNRLGYVVLDPQITQITNGSGGTTFTSTGGTGGTGVYTQVIAGLGRKECSLQLNIKGTPTGTSPQLSIQVQELDPIDLTTVFTGFSPGYTIGPYVAPIITGSYFDTTTSACLVTVTVTGAGASFTGVDIWLVNKEATIIYGQNYIGSTEPMSAVAIDEYNNSIVTKVDGSKQTYSCSMAVTPAASATDVATITGNATTTVRVTRVTVTGEQTTAGQVKIALVLRSAADTGGTHTTGTAVPHDSNDVAADATLLNYSANPTPGAVVGTFREDFVFLPGAATAVDAQGKTWEFGDRPGGRAIVLRGAAQVLAVNLAGVTVTGGSLFVTFEWTEETGTPT